MSYTRNAQKSKVRKINSLNKVELKAFIDRLVKAGGETSKACVHARQVFARLK